MIKKQFRKKSADTDSLKHEELARALVVPFCLMLIVFVSAKLQAQETPLPMLLSADEAVRLALQNNLGLESARIGLDTKRRASEYSWNQFIPQVMVSGTLNVDNEARTVSGLTYVPWDSKMGFLGLTQPQVEMTIPTVGTLYNYVMPYSTTISQSQVVGNISISLNLSAAMFENMNRLRIEYESGLINYEKAKAQLERDVRKAYHNMLLLQENIAVLRGTFTNVERQVQIAQANYNAGLAPELTLLQARVSLENLRPAIEQAENGMRLYMAQFAFYLGMEYNTQFQLAPLSENFDFISFDVAEMISQAARGRPDIQELRHTILMLESARKMQTLALTPFLRLSWSSTSINIDPMNQNWFKYDNWMRSGNLQITLGLNLHSFLPWSADTQSIRNLDDSLRTATIGLAQMIRGTEIEVYNIVLSLERTYTNTQALAQTVALAEQAYRLTEQAYRAGLQDYFQVQNAEQSLHQARVQLLEQQFTYLNGLIDLEYAIGVPFGTLSGRRD